MKKTFTFLAAVPLMIGSVFAVPTEMTVDEIIFQNGAGLDSSKLSPKITMSLSGSTLSISLQNLSPDDAGDGALVLFTGLAFDLPTGVTVTGGSVTGFSGSPSSGWSLTGANNAWGWDNNPGGLSNGGLAYATLTGYDTRASTIASDGKKAFDGTGNAGGMDYGVFGALESSTSPGPWVKDQLNIALNLTGTVPVDLIAQIENGNVAAIFGSPNGRPSVPDGGFTLALLGVGVLGVGALRRCFPR